MMLNTSLTIKPYLLYVMNSGNLLVETVLKLEGGTFKIKQETFEYKFSVVDGLFSVSFSFGDEVKSNADLRKEFKSQATQTKASNLILLKEKLDQIEKELQNAMKNKLATKIGEKMLEKADTETEFKKLEETKELSITAETKMKTFTITNMNPKVVVALPEIGYCVFELFPICEPEEVWVKKRFDFQPEELVVEEPIAIVEESVDSPSSLLSLEHFRRLESQAGYPKKLGNLLFLATRDGFTAGDVVRKTKGKSQSLVICKVEENGRVFGGFTNVSLATGSESSSGKYYADCSAFVFTITERSEIRIFPVANFQNAVHRYKGRGIDFGGGGTICVLQDGNSQGQRNGRCWSGSGTYIATDGLPFTDNTLAGARDFKVSEVEVFSLFPQ